MLVTVLFCTVGLAFAGDGSGYNYPKPSIPFGEEICPPGSNGVFPNCEHSPPPQPQGKCASGYSGEYPACTKDVIEKSKQCPPPTVGKYPNCLLPPCPPNFTGTFPNCKKPVVEQKCAPPAIGTFPNCVIPPCPPGFTGIFPNCERPASAGGYLPPSPTGMCGMDWQQFKTFYNKTYADEGEEHYRQHIFQQNQQIIATHNALYEQGLETYSLCMNKFGDWLHEEYLGINGIDLSVAESADLADDSSENSDEGYEYESHGSQSLHGTHSANSNEVFGDEARSYSGSSHASGNSNSASTNAASQQGENSNSGSSNAANQQEGNSNSGSPNAANQQGGNSISGSSKAANQQGANSATGDSPDTKDWRKEGAVTSVKDQLMCASCWAFSAAGALEAQFFLKNGVLNSLSEQQLVDCSRPFANNGCNTGYMTNAFLYTKNNGILTEEEYPYEAKDNKCRANPNSMKNKKLNKIPKGSEAKLKEAVGTIGPVSVGLDATHDKFMFYSDGVYFNPDCKPERISHAVLAIGYDVDEKTGMDYWIIKNSYGTSWGEGGYGKLARNKDNHCGISNLASYPIV